MITARPLVLVAATALALVGAVAAAPANAAGPENYSPAADLPIGMAAGINDAGDVVAWGRFGAPDGPGTLQLANGTRIALSGPNDGGFGDTVSSISRHGRAAGYYYDNNFNAVGVTWDLTGRAAALPGYAGVPAGTSPDVRPVGINDKNQLVGTAYRPGHGDVATRWSVSHKAFPIDPTGSDVTVNAINDNALVAGAEGGHAALFEPNGTVLHLARVTGETSSVAVALNDSGEAVGSAVRNGATIPVYWDPAGHVHGVARPGGATNVTLSGINEAGEFAGAVTLPHHQTAVVWTTPSTPSLLPYPVVPDARVGGVTGVDINDSGTVVGYGNVAAETFEYQASFVWTRTS